jgi:glutamate-1-semialdehyde 2,1-aminomutase
MLPQPIVNRALDEWLEYRDKECRPESVKEVDTLIGCLSRPRPENVADLQEDFVRFTNVLDRSRGQSLAAADPVLYDVFVENGFDFGA